MHNFNITTDFQIVDTFLNLVNLNTAFTENCHLHGTFGWQQDQITNFTSLFRQVITDFIDFI